MRFLPETATLLAVCATGIHAQLLGPVYPAPRDLSSRESRVSSSWRNVTATFDKLLSSKLNATAAQSVLLKDLTFSVGMFSVHDSGASTLQYHHTGPEIANSTAGVNKVDGDSIYGIASGTKAFTVLAGLLELEPEDWERPLTDIFPAFADFIHDKDGHTDPVRNVQWDKITLRAIAAQIGGVPRGSIPFTPGDILLNYIVAQSTGTVTPESDPATYGLPPIDVSDPSIIPPCANDLYCTGNDFAAGMADEYPVFQPWASPAYANNGFILLGQAIANLTGKPLDQIYQESIFDPLEMTSSRATAPPESDYARYVITGDPAASIANDPGIAVSSGGLFSSTNDYAKFGVAVLNSTLLPEEQTRRWMKPVSHTAHLRYSVGAPWEIYRYTHASGAVTDIYTKSGDSGFYSSYIVLLPEFDAGFSVISCSQKTSRSTGTALVGDIVSEIVLPALMDEAAREAQRGFAGTYVSTTEGLNSSITLSVQNSPSTAPGLAISSWISNGTDVLPHLSGFGLSAKARFVPSIPLKSETGQAAFRPYTPTTHGIAGPPSQGLFSNFYAINDWVAVDALTYGGISPALMVFDVEDGKAVSVSLPGYQAKLERK